MTAVNSWPGLTPEHSSERYNVRRGGKTSQILHHISSIFDCATSTCSWLLMLHSSWIAKKVLAVKF